MRSILTLSYTTKRARRVGAGFSVTELAVVLAVSGILMGGIWVMVRSVWEYYERQHAVEEVANIVANVRSYYTGQIGIPHSGDATTTSNLIKMGIIPGSVQRSNTGTCTNPSNLCADTPWGEVHNGAIDAGGTLRVCDWVMGTSTACPTAASGGTAGPFFAVALRGLTTGACISVAQKIATTAGATGLVEVNINGTNLVQSGKGINPMAAADANTNCIATASGAAIVTFVFRLTQASY